jgi:hypothetical protein
LLRSWLLATDNVDYTLAAYRRIGKASHLEAHQMYTDQNLIKVR